ncbi:MAG TPA: hydrogenase maturation protease [Chromatiales bacterium]|nr:hydrogenase maturation protease [Chromatiales bacterium]
MKEALVLGIGNTLLQDDGVGVRVMQILAEQREKWPGVRFVDGGTLSFTLADTVGRADRMLAIDGANMGAAPGEVRLFRNAEIDEQLRTTGGSVHEVSLSDLFDMARLTDMLPRQRALIAIQVQSTGWGEHLTAPVSRGVARAVALAESVLDRWHG